MAQIDFKIQQFRANDIVDNGGKQFELGKAWCIDFFQIPTSESSPIINLTFKPLSEKHAHLADYHIELKLAEVTKREDRKAYSNSTTGRSQIKDLFIDKLHLKWPENSKDYFAIMKIDTGEYYLYYIPQLMYDNFISFFKSQNINITHTTELSASEVHEQKNLQQIFYGAPGTSKSYTINKKTKDKEVIRTTFHPDSDYSTFVGAYKPTTDMLPICNELGEPMKIGGTSLHKEQIVYKFVAQAFLQAYIQAWKMWKDGHPQYLVIEEINRGNCAQIFGDLFQLLDRNDAGYSDYPITADKDMQKQLRIAFNDLTLSSEKIDEINSMYNGKPIAEKILEGELLVLPNNLYIWATMNTSDQSLFPIDSAFKRRWDWTYMPISDAGKNWAIQANGNYYDWWDFVTKINTEIATTTNSEDKKLGYFFCKANNDKVITAERFVGKVLFYLWNDVFKDYEFNNDIFNDAKDIEGEKEKLTFDKFYTTEGENSSIVENKVELFLHNLGLTALSDKIENIPSETMISSSNFEITINGQKVQYVNAIPYTTIEQYVKLNPDKTSEEILRTWEPFKQYSIRKWIVASKEERDTYKDGEYSHEIVCADGKSIFVNKDGWMYHPQNGLRDTISEFIQAVNSKNFGITIKEISLQ